MKRGALRRLLPMILLAGLGAAASPAFGQNVVLTVDRTTTLNFIRAATPYEFEVSLPGFTESFTLYNPRELRFEGGKIRLKVDCRGEPIGFSALLEPTMAVYFDRARGAFVAKVESLPIKLGSFGTIALDRYLDPIELPVSFSQTLESGLPGLTIDTVIRDVKVLEDRIEAKADLVFKKLAPPSQNAARARSKP